MPFIPLQTPSASSSPNPSSPTQGFTPLAGEKLTPVNAKAPPQSSLLDDYIEHVKGGATAAGDFLGAIPGSIASGLSVPYSAVKSLATGSDMADEVAKNAEASMKAFQPSEYIKLSPEAERGRQAAQGVFNKPAELGAEGLKGAAMLPYIAADKLGITEHGADFAQQMLHGDTPEMAPGFNALTETAGMVPGYGVFGIGGKGGTLEKTMGKDLEGPKDPSIAGREPIIEDHGKYQVIKDSTGRVTKVVDKETGKVTDYTEPMSQGPLDVDAVIGGHPAEPGLGKEPLLNEPREPQIGETRSPEELAQEAQAQAEIDFKRSQNINYDAQTIGYDRLNKRRKATPEAPDLTLETPEEAQARVLEHKETARDISHDLDILRTESPQAAGGRVARQRISELKEKLGQYGQYTGEILDRIQGDKPLENQIGKVKTQVDKINSLLEDRLIQLSDSTFVRNGEIARTKEVRAKYGKWTREVMAEKDKLNQYGEELHSRLEEKYGDFVNGPLPQEITKSQTYRGKQGGAIDLSVFAEGFKKLKDKLGHVEKLSAANDNLYKYSIYDKQTYEQVDKTLTSLWQQYHDLRDTGDRLGGLLGNKYGSELKAIKSRIEELKNIESKKFEEALPNIVKDQVSQSMREVHDTLTAKWKEEAKQEKKASDIAAQGGSAKILPFNKQSGAIDLQAIKEGVQDIGRRLKTGWDAMMERREPRMGEPLQEGGLEMLKRGYDAATAPYEPQVYRAGDQAGYRMNKGPGGSQRGAIDPFSMFDKNLSTEDFIKRILQNKKLKTKSFLKYIQEVRPDIPVTWSDPQETLERLHDEIMLSHFSPSSITKEGMDAGFSIGKAKAREVLMDVIAEFLAEKDMKKPSPYGGPGKKQGGAVMSPWERKDPVYQETKQKLTEEQMAREHEEFARLAQSRNTKQPELAPIPSSSNIPASKVISGMKTETLIDDLKAKLDEYKKGPNWKALGELLLGPMSGSPAEAAGHIKTFADKVAFAQLARARMIGIMNKLKKSELKGIYDARQADELGEKQGYKAKNGQDTLPQKSKKIADVAQEDYRDAWQEAQETGTMVGGYENYTPRRVIALLSDGTVKSLAELTRKESIGGVYGPKRTSGSLIGRKYLTAEETEAAAKESFGDNVQLIRDIRVLPLVTAELRKVSATKVLLERIRKYGNDNFIETVSTEPQRGWQTVNHPAFRNVWVHPDYSPAIEAILNQKPSNIVARILMTTKAKSTGLLLLNPGIHNTLIFSRAIPMAPLNVLTGQAYMKGAALRGSPLPNWMFEAYNIPRRMFNFPEIERKSQEEGWAYQKDAMLHNFRPPSRAAKFEDSDTYTDPKIGNSWTAQLTGQAARVFNKQVEAMQTVDKIGEFWHESMLWNRVADLGMYIYDKAWRDMVKTGMTEDNAKYAAGGLANRYMSTMPIESMSKGLRTFLNIILLSRQLNVSNLGIYKDFIAGLPNEVRGQINDAHQVQLGNKYLQSKQMKSLLVDMVVMYWGVNAALQSGIAAYKKNGEFFDNLGKEGKAYAERFTDFIQREGENPLVFLDDSVGVSPLTRNEDNKKDRIYLGNDTNDQGMYLKNLFGGTGERLTKMFTHPADLGKQLQSQHMKFLLGNDFKGGVFSKDVWGPDDKALTGIEKIGAVAKTFADSYLSPNSQTLDSISESSKDNPNQINKLKLIGALAPVSFSKGRPGGPQQAVLNAEKAREDFRFMQAKKAIDNSLDRDDTEAAYDKLIESGKDTKEAISYIKQHYGLEKKSSEQQVKMYKKGNEDTIQQFEQVNNY